ncbi:MAG: hypothetical protein JO061_01660 [Acidobacteriaceae bacterium]|nr:hypothetical protein [Acidobacteriaceae bacterium]
MKLDFRRAAMFAGAILLPFVISAKEDPVQWSLVPAGGARAVAPGEKPGWS